jgi:hypothetical protein
VQDFTHYIGIDWSGARGARQSGLAAAIMDRSTNHVTLVEPIGKYKSWSREGLVEAIASKFDLPVSARVLIGIDSSFSFPWLDKEVYFPTNFFGEDARQFWRHVDEICVDDPNLSANSFVEKYRDHFLTPKNRGRVFEPRLRVTEQRCNEMGMGRAESSFHLIGPSQVGLSALTTARMLHSFREDENIAIWPFDQISDHQIVLLETFSTLHVRVLGHKGKVRDLDMLKTILNEHQVRYSGGGAVNDHQADAILTAVGLSKLAKQEKYWYPSALTEDVKKTEGWTFGVI